MDHVQLCQKSLRSLQILRDQNNFFDVTLMTDDHKTHAHKSVLSAFSPFFKDIFESFNVKEHLFLYLDVRKENLLGILDYIYRGEVSVPVNQIEQFIKAASKLKISELIKVNIEDQENLVGKTHAQKKSLATSSSEKELVKVEDQGNLHSITGKDGCEYQFWEQVKEQSIQNLEGNPHQYNILEPLNKDNEKMTLDIPCYINAEVEEERISMTPKKNLNDLLNYSKLKETVKIRKTSIKENQLANKGHYVSDQKPVPNKVRKKKANSTSIHEEFTRYQYTAEGGEERIGSRCNECGYQMKDINPTNLKFHYKRKHRSIYEIVKGRGCHNLNIFASFLHFSP